MASTLAKRPLRAAIIGAGMSGILAGIKLREAGIAFTIYEKAARAGGTWRENRYPGIACDVPSHHYCYSFAPNPEWSQRFSPGPEILAYFEQVAVTHEIDSRIRFNEEVVSAVYGGGEWRIKTARGHEETVDIVLCATGFLHHPVLPNIPGRDKFTGDAFHSARWDESVMLAGRRVGIIGTGSTAMQIVPAIVDTAAKVTMFQRTAQWVLPLPNVAYTEEEKAQFRAEPDSMTKLYATWLERFQNTISRAVVGDALEMSRLEAGCRENLEHNVHDPVLRAKLTPDYKVGCKRLIMSDIFYPAIQRPNAELVTSGIERIEPHGVRDREGNLHELDVLVYATGFNGHAFMRPMQVLGVEGKRLDDTWAQSNLTHRSMSVPGFPNFFMLVGPYSPIGNFSVILISELQLNYLQQLLAPLQRGDCRAIAPTFEATNAFLSELRGAMGNTVWATGCKSWYLDKTGSPEMWPFTFERFRDDMSRPRFEEYDLIH
ncbi:MAG: NAD(P)/FAD-dependent oxidoreductase [Gammaproteobacteria bacterium]|nr:NAD(P)/FAD-dependent oxidoreductase [Gammaproteobacteria bacterium]